MTAATHATRGATGSKEWWRARLWATAGKTKANRAGDYGRWLPGPTGSSQCCEPSHLRRGPAGGRRLAAHCPGSDLVLVARRADAHLPDLRLARTEAAAERPAAHFPGAGPANAAAEARRTQCMAEGHAAGKWPPSRPVQLGQDSEAAGAEVERVPRARWAALQTAAEAQMLRAAGWLGELGRSRRLGEGEAAAPDGSRMCHGVRGGSASARCRLHLAEPAWWFSWPAPGDWCTPWGWLAQEDWRDSPSRLGPLLGFGPADATSIPG